MITKCIFACGLLGLAVWPAVAQVTVELALDQEQFLQGESLPLAVKITNTSGQQLHLGADDTWLTFNVESYEGFVVMKNAEVPVKGAFDLESSQQATKHVDIAPSFILNKLGRYKVTATLNIKDWSKEFKSKPKDFDLVNGARLWTQDFGLPTTNGAPEMRRYALEQDSYLAAQMRLYVQVTALANGQVLKTCALGPTVKFNKPEAVVDRYSMLHVLWQTGGQAFNYSLVNSDGEILRSEIYDDYGSRPRLVVDTNDDVRVKGGVRRPRPGELPPASPPPEVPATGNK
jgi:hypothetical protein